MGWAEVADAVVNRRVELGWRTRREFAEVTGLSVKTLGEIERHERTSYDKSTLAIVEQTLKWSPGTIQSIAANGIAVATPDPAPPGPTAFGRYLLRAIHDAGYDTTTFARAADLNPAAIVRWAYGATKPKAEDLSLIAALLNVPTEELIARAAEVDGIPAGMPIPAQVAEFLDLYWTADEAKRARMLEFMSHVNAMMR